ncbi:hypothetical protein HPP92_027055 [Vanilla planifolia]|uniref:Pentatricopeptide repeat-containing protein n=1 Tax=Vanilla planifolia TaxID=51239 RepID=A0A835PE56_VANPL|nr:hypothetical protein HPP92_027055 [Vanilla planifolia]
MAAVFGSPPPQPVPRLPRPPSSLRSFLSTYHHPSTFFRLDRHASALQSPPPSISGCGAGGRWSIEKRIQESLAILDLMESQSISLDASLLCSILKSCADARSLRLGRLAHDKALRAGLHTNPYVANSLLLLYSRCGLLDAARQLFDEMPVRNVVTWTTAISMYQQAGFPNVALDLYQLMRDGADQAIKPNAFTYCSVLNCCAGVKDLGLGLRVHEQIIEEGLQNDRFLIVALIDMYTKCGKVSHARKVFDCVPQPTLEAYTAMIEGYSGNGLTSESVELIRMVLRTGSVADKVTALGFMTIIRPCVMQMSLRHGQEIHAHIIKFGHNPGYKQLSAIVSLYEMRQDAFCIPIV